MVERDERRWTYFEIECPVEVEEKIDKLLATMSFEELVNKVEEKQGGFEKVSIEELKERGINGFIDAQTGEMTQKLVRCKTCGMEFSEVPKRVVNA